MDKYSYNVKQDGFYKAETIDNCCISTFQGYMTRNVLCNFSLKDYLTISFGCKPVKDLCSKMREIDKNTHKDEYDKIKSQLMSATISCACSETRDKNHICVRNPLICLDFDAKDNPCLYDDAQRKNVIEELYNWEYCYTVGTSCSGKGVFCIVPIVSNDDDNDFLGYFYSLQESFKKAGLIIDKNCKDVTRLRTCSAEKPRVKTDSNVRCWCWQQWPVIEHHLSRPMIQLNPNATVNDYTLSVELLNMLSNSPVSFDSYDDWYRLGFILAPLGDIGYQIFDNLSAMSANYKGASETYQKWQQTAPKSTKTITDTVRFAIAMAKRYIGKNAVLQAKVNLLKKKQK